MFERALLVLAGARLGIEQDEHAEDVVPPLRDREEAGAVAGRPALPLRPGQCSARMVAAS